MKTGNIKFCVEKSYSQYAYIAMANGPHGWESIGKVVPIRYAKSKTRRNVLVPAMWACAEERDSASLIVYATGKSPHEAATKAVRKYYKLDAKQETKRR